MDDPHIKKLLAGLWWEQPLRGRLNRKGDRCMVGGGVSGVREDSGARLHANPQGAVTPVLMRTGRERLAAIDEEARFKCRHWGEWGLETGKERGLDSRGHGMSVPKRAL